VAGIKDGRQAHALLEGPHHDLMDLVIENMTGTLKVDGEDGLVHPVGFVPVLIPHGPAVAGVVEEEAEGGEGEGKQGRREETKKKRV